jgi:small subunit ribosomal protein S17
MKNKIGMDLKAPKKECNDNNCPFHGSLKIRTKEFTGTVLSDKMTKTVIVGWERMRKVHKYERFEKVNSKVKAHLPPCIDAKIGDRVRIFQTRPLSKTKNFVVVENLSREEKDATNKG